MLNMHINIEYRNTILNILYFNLYLYNKFILENQYAYRLGKQRYRQET